MNLEDYFMPYRVVDLIIGVNFNTPVYSLRDINTFGKPDLWGIYFYEVRDDKTESCPFVLDFKGEQERRGALRPVHRYSEVKRFEVVLKKFLNGNFRCRALANQNIYDVVEMFIDRDKNRVWNSCRKVLKEYGWSSHYDNIPYILQKIGYEYKIVYNGNICEIVEDFVKIVYNFKKKKFEGRKYLLNYRYLALKLMERHGVVFEYYIPKLQTFRKINEFEQMWQVFESFLN
jgi:hypothetical protein